METSRSELDASADGRAATDPAVDLRISTAASGEEAAAIAAAIETYLADERAAETGGEPTWHGRRWAFAGRLDALTGRAARVPTTAPTNAWSALGRAGRY